VITAPTIRHFKSPATRGAETRTLYRYDDAEKYLIKLLTEEHIAHLHDEFAGLLISIIAIDSDIIGDTFEVSLSAILLDVSIAIGDIFSTVSLSIIAILLESIVNIVALWKITDCDNSVLPFQIVIHIYTYGNYLSYAHRSPHSVSYGLRSVTNRSK
jgi:hypothetical protein